MFFWWSSMPSRWCSVPCVRPREARTSITRNNAFIIASVASWLVPALWREMPVHLSCHRAISYSASCCSWPPFISIKSTQKISAPAPRLWRPRTGKLFRPCIGLVALCPVLSSRINPNFLKKHYSGMPLCFGVTNTDRSISKTRMRLRKDACCLLNRCYEDKTSAMG